MGASLTRQGAEAGSGGDVLEQKQYLTFMLNGQVFAIGILHIKEIIEHGIVTAMPMMPEFIRGVINLRGHAVPVVDLAARFGASATQVGKRTCIVILEIAGADGPRDLGVVVDAVNEVLEIPREEIEPPPEFGAAIDTEFVMGMGKVNGRFVIILNVRRILSMDELSRVGTLQRRAAESATGSRTDGNVNTGV